jgi:type IV pilus assembly protein PilB
VRVLCPGCREQTEVTPEALVAIGAPEELAESMHCFQAVGCTACSGTGYKGRIALYEVMPMTDPIREGILAGASNNEIKRAAIDAGMDSLRRSGITKIAEGRTTIDEVLRITMPD